MTKKLLQQLLAIAVMVLFALVIVLTYLPLDSNTKKETSFKINSGNGSAKVARLLTEQGLIRSRYLFVGYTLLAGKEKELKAGRYLISPAMSIPEIAGIFSEGKAEPEGILVTVPEGSNGWEAAKIFSKNPENFLNNEGYLFPDTYWFEENETENGILKKMKENFGEKTKNLDITSEIVTIASLLEKEVRTEEDMHLVAGIIYKRLELGMPLQIDATVAYGVCRPNAEVDRPASDVALVFDSKSLKASGDFASTNKAISGRGRPDIASGLKYCDVTQVNLIENIKIDSPYNTYTRKGLPAGSISNPGLKAIKAALDPTESDYLYYLSTRDDGRTIFSKTAKEHQQNRTKYLKL